MRIVRIVNFAVQQDGQIIGNTPIKEQAIGAAKTRAQQTGSPVSVIAKFDTGKEKEIAVHADGTIVRLWDTPHVSA